MLGLKLNHVSKRGHSETPAGDINFYHIILFDVFEMQLEDPFQYEHRHRYTIRHTCQPSSLLVSCTLLRSVVACIKAHVHSAAGL